MRLSPANEWPVLVMPESICEISQDIGEKTAGGIYNFVIFISDVALNSRLRVMFLLEGDKKLRHANLGPGKICAIFQVSLEARLLSVSITRVSAFVSW